MSPFPKDTHTFAAPRLSLGAQGGQKLSKVSAHRSWQAKGPHPSRAAQVGLGPQQAQRPRERLREKRAGHTGCLREGSRPAERAPRPEGQMGRGSLRELLETPPRPGKLPTLFPGSGPAPRAQHTFAPSACRRRGHATCEVRPCSSSSWPLRTRRSFSMAPVAGRTRGHSPPGRWRSLRKPEPETHPPTGSPGAGFRRVGGTVAAAVAARACAPWRRRPAGLRAHAPRSWGSEGAPRSFPAGGRAGCE